MVIVFIDILLTSALVGRKNRHCLCATCERNGVGGYGPQGSDEDVSETGSGSGAEAEAASRTAAGAEERLFMDFWESERRRGAWRVSLKRRVRDGERDLRPRRSSM